MLRGAFQPKVVNKLAMSSPVDKDLRYLAVRDTNFVTRLFQNTRIQQILYLTHPIFRRNNWNWLILLLAHLATRYIWIDKNHMFSLDAQTWWTTDANYLRRHWQKARAYQVELKILSNLLKPWRTEYCFILRAYTHSNKLFESPNILTNLFFQNISLP